MINEKLFKAVETGNADEVEKALTEEKINATTYYGAKSIVLATKQENSEILTMLLKNGAKINRESFWRRTAFCALCAAKNAKSTEILDLLLEYGAGVDKRILDHALAYKTRTYTNNAKFCYEDSVSLPEKSSKDNIFIPYARASKDNRFIQYAREGNIEEMKGMLKGVSEKVLLTAVDAALLKNRWDVAMYISEYSNERDVEVYTECILKMFFKSSYTGDKEKVKFFLEKLIENFVGVLTDETGKSTLEIAMENNPADIIQILTNYGFHENSLRHAYECLSQ